MNKLCTKCNVTKSISEFSKRKDRPSYRPHCKQCTSKANNERNKTNKEIANKKREEFEQHVLKQFKLKMEGLSK